jgi:hypothetical protein
MLLIAIALGGYVSVLYIDRYFLLIPLTYPSRGESQHGLLEIEAPRDDDSFEYACGTSFICWCLLYSRYHRIDMDVDAMARTGELFMYCFHFVLYKVFLQGVWCSYRFLRSVFSSLGRRIDLTLPV